MKAKDALALYVCFPRDVAKFPPIAHRGDDDKAWLTPFEFAVLAGVLGGAWAALGRQWHAASMKAGHVAVKQERHYAQRFKDAWDKRRASDEDTPAPKRRSILYLENPYKPRLRWGKRLVKKVATRGYKQKQQKLRKQPPPEIVTLTLTRYRLSRLSGLAKKGDNLSRLDAALDRLCHFVGHNNEAPDPPPIVNWSPQGRKLEIRVSGEWLKPPYVRVAMPLPLRSATATALYLFLHVTQDGGEIAFDTLCGRLGIPDYGGAVASRALKDALQIVNAHLAAFAMDQCHALLDAGIDLPEEYEIKSVDDGRLIGFTAHRTHWPDDIDDGDGRVEFDGDDDEADIDADEAKGEADADEQEQDEAPIERRRRGTLSASVEADPDTTDADEAPIKRRPIGTGRRADVGAITGGDMETQAATETDEDDDPKWLDYEY